MVAKYSKKTTPREQGYRMPAEWERQSAVWLQWPERYPDPNQPDRLRYQMRMEKTWLLIAWEIHRHTMVCILVHNHRHRAHIETSMRYFGFDMTRITFHIAPIGDIWHRDTGPVFVIDDCGGLAAVDWHFNGWGSYPEDGETERKVPATVAHILGVPLFDAPMISEGGAIEVNGTGSMLATRSSIINDNRNPGMSQQRIESILNDYLGASHVIWLSGAPPEICEQELGDVTDFHIDIAARFVGRHRVLYSWTEDTSDPRYPYLKRHLEELRAATDERGVPLELTPLLLPADGVYAIGGRYDDLMSAGSDLTDASYANYLVTNDLVLVPAFGNRHDVLAQRVLAECFPGRVVVPVPAVTLTAEGGAIHCVTQQQPAC